MEPDWIENKTADLIARARRSKYAKDIFADAAYFRSLGYVDDVALQIAINYWLS